MIKLIIADQTDVNRPKVIPFKNGSSIHDIITKQFGVLDPREAKVFLNGDQVFPTEFKTITKPLAHNDEVKVIREVKGTVRDIIGNFDPLLSAADDLVGDLFNSLINFPETDTALSGSPNNSYTSQTNIIRAFAQKAVMCGSPKSYPDLIGEAIEYYVNNIKQSEQYFFVCFGTLNGGTVQAGNTRLNGITFAGSSFTRYEPVSGVTTIPNYRYGRSVDEVDGQTVKGTNEGQDGATYALNAINDSTPPNTPATYTGTTFIYYVNTTTAASQLDADRISAGGSLDVRVVYNLYDSNGIPSQEEGAGLLTDSELLPEDPGVSREQWKFTVENFNGPKSPVDDYNGNIVDGFDTTILLPGIIGPFVNPTQTEKMLFNIRFDRGLKATVPIKVVVYELDSKGGTRTGVSQTFNVSYTEDSVDSIYRTFEINISNGVSWYEFTLERTNAASLDTAEPDIPTLEKVFCITENGDTDFSNATMMKVVMQSTQLPTGGGVDSKVNIIDGQVEMPSYDINTGDILPNAPSRNFADAVLFLVKDFYGYPDEECKKLLDLDSLYTIANSLPDNLKQFDYTFDDVKQSFEDRLAIICNVARVGFYREANQFVFWRDEAVSNPSTALTRRDIINQASRQYSISRSLFVSNGKDSIQLEYIDRATNKPKYLYRSIDSGGNIVNVAGANPKKVTLTGCQNAVNATNRADLEIRKMLYQHTQGSDTFLSSQKLLSKGDVVLWDEIYETQGITTGHILSKSGLTATLSNGVDTTKNYSMYYNNVDGYIVGPQSVTVDSKHQITATNLDEVYNPEGDSTLGSPYFLVETTATPSLWRVVDKQISSDSVQLTMVTYDARIYEND